MAKGFGSDYDDSKELKEFQELHEDIDEYASSPMDQNGTWLLSYADLMTLVACFFIMLVAMANFDDISFQEKAKNFAMYFRGSLLESKGKEQKKVITGTTEKESEAQKNETTMKPKAKKNLHSYINEEVKSASISEISPPKDIKVVFSGSAMFLPGKVDLSPEVEDSLDIMIDLIMARNPNFIILFEGHTDDTDISNKVYPSNWELSAARAARVLKKFEKAGIPSEKLVAVGYGDSRPTYQNRDEDGQAIPSSQRLNRRVVIKVLNETDAPDTDSGLGVFFRDQDGKKVPLKPQKTK